MERTNIRGVQTMLPTISKTGIITKTGCVHSGWLVFEAPTVKMVSNLLSGTFLHFTTKADVTGGIHFRGVQAM